MEYQIVFEAGGCGVWSRHDDEESARKHVHLLKLISSPRDQRWEITHRGETLEKFPKRGKK